MRDFFRGIWFKILLGIMAVLLGLLLYEASSGQLSAPTQILGTIAQPFTRAASWIAGAVEGAVDPFIHAFSYKSENEKLKSQVADLQNQLVNYNAMENENEQLKEIVGIKNTNPDFEMVPGKVISRESLDQNAMFTISAGSLQGVKKNDPVITSQGLIGIITDVSLTYSQVTTLLSPQLNIGANDSRTGEYGVVSGDYDLARQGLCQMAHVSKDSGIANGSLIITSGGSGLLPDHLVIGSVQEMRVDRSGMSANAVILPIVDIRSVASVTVVKNFKGKIG